MNETPTDGIHRYPCPCDGCDSYTLVADEYCAKCLHQGCGLEVCCK